LDPVIQGSQLVRMGQLVRVLQGILGYPVYPELRAHRSNQVPHSGQELQALQLVRVYHQHQVLR